jgi:hypothetical protein
MEVRRPRYNKTCFLFLENEKFVKKPAICSPYYDTVKIIFLINLLKHTGYGMHQQFGYFNNCTLCNCIMCFVFVWEQTATCAIHIKNLLVFITEMKSVYSAVGTGPLIEAVCAPSFKG